MRKTIITAAALLILPFFAAAQDQPAPAPPPLQAAPPQVAAPASGEDRVKALEEQVRLLAEQLAQIRGELQELRAAKESAPASSTESAAAAPAPAPVAAAPQVYGGATSNAKLLNPDISMIGDFIGTAGRNPVSSAPFLEMHESELGIQAIVDPYARADFFVSFGETGVNVEEGFITFTSLPAGFVAKVGKMRAAFGKVNTIHNHALSFIDRPLVTNNLLAGEDGLNDAGFSVTRILPAPGNWFLEGTAQVFRGDSGDVFTSSRRQDASVIGHLRTYRDLGESTNLDLGVSYARGHNANGSDYLTSLYGVDATLRWKPLRRAIYHSMLWRSEFFWSHRDQLSPTDIFQTQRAFGLYSSIDYRVNRRWTVGGRFDRSARATDSTLVDNGASAILTYWPSEFSQVRGQYRFGHYAEGLTANEFLFQFLFVLGAHGAHPF
ncbi:MAG: hypothetical protein LAN71_11675 [Acidobacteriia bacterium]|nr:hypothetical protein [Terriglobia bacterium]